MEHGLDEIQALGNVMAQQGHTSDFTAVGLSNGV